MRHVQIRELFTFHAGSTHRPDLPYFPRTTSLQAVSTQMIAAGVNAKALSTYMGHSTISITMDRYGHLMPGSEDEAAGLLNAYLYAQLEGAAVQARGATGEQVANEISQPLA